MIITCKTENGRTSWEFVKILTISDVLIIFNLFEIDSYMALKMFGLTYYIRYMINKNPYMKNADYFKIRGELFEKLPISELASLKKTRKIN
jgi:hypothetical protein